MMKKILPLLMGRYLNLIAVLFPKLAGVHGFRIFCYPFRVPIKSHQKKFLLEGAFEKLDVEGVSIQVYRWGVGRRRILLLHGWQSHTYRWKNYIQAFSPDEFTVYALDAPGHGLSTGSFLTVPLYGKVVETFLHKVENIDTIVAHSLGAFTALYTVSRQQKTSVRKLVLLASPGEASEFIKFYKETLKLTEASVGHVMSHFAKVIEHPIEYFSAPRFSQSLELEGLLIHDEDDDDTPHTHSVAIHHSWRKSELILTKGLGHNLKAPWIIEKVVDFVRINDRRAVREKSRMEQ